MQLEEKIFKLFKSSVASLPVESGYGQQAWPTALSQQFLLEEFHTKYSRCHVQPYGLKAGLISKRPWPESGMAVAELRHEILI